MWHINRREWDAAWKLYQEVVQKNPNHVGALGNLGTISLQRRIPKQARTYLMRALSIKPDNSTMWLNLAIAESALGNRNDAANYCRKALSIDPSNGNANRLLNDLQRQR